MFKKLLSGKQNQDATLHEKSYRLFSMGKSSAWLVLIGGTLAVFAIATLICNAVQILITILFDTHIGLLSGNLTTTGSFVISNLFSLHVLFFNEHLLEHVLIGQSLFFVHHGVAISTFIRWVAFVSLEYVVYRFFINLYAKSRNLNNNEYGDSRIATIDEVKSETVKVPDRYDYFATNSGTIAMHKFNLRGKVNKSVKQQLQGLQTHLNLNTFDQRVFSSVGYLVIFILLADFGLALIRDFGTPSRLRHWYSPYSLVADVINVLTWVLSHLFSLIQYICGGFVSTFWPSVPLYIQIPIGLVIALAIGYGIFKIAGLYYYKNHQGQQNSLDKGALAKFTKSDTSTRTTKNESTGAPIKTPHDKSQQAFSSVKQILVSLTKLYHHPVLSVKYIWFNTLSHTMNLDKGITGYYYLNPKQQNIILYGITRSGKGQMVINPLIDINSRASEQKNMIINDPKGELAAGSYKTLRERGYDVKVINIMDMSHSMSYNPLALVVTNAQQGDTGRASTECSELSYTIYDPSDKGENSYFYTSAANLFDAMVFASLALAHGQAFNDSHPKLDFSGDADKKVGLLDKAALGDQYQDALRRKQDAVWAKVTITNVLQMTSQLGGETATADGDSEASNRLIVYFTHLAHILDGLRKQYKNEGLDDVETDQLNLLDTAVQKFQQSKMAGNKTAGNIYSTFLEGLRIYQQPDVGRMTSMNSFDSTQLGFDRLLTVQFDRSLNLQNLQTELMTASFDGQKYVAGKVLEKNESHLSEIGLAQIPFEHEIDDDHFFVKLTITDERVQTGLDSTNPANQFQWLILCTKRYYDYQTVKNKKADFRQAPEVADIELNDQTKTATDHYTGKKVFYRIDMTIAAKPNSIDFDVSPLDQSSDSPLKKLVVSPDEALKINQLNFMFNQRPTALFLVTPPNRVELNQLCTFIINQTFNVLSDLALRVTKSQHIQRPLQMLLDELGNLPAIPKLDTKASIGLSQHIEMLLVFQDREQAVAIYKKNVTDIVISNCATTYYILSKSKDTIQEISDGFGERTVESTTLNHDPTRITSANYNENEIAQKVMSPDRLRRLKVGEIAILRSNDRSTIWGQDSAPLPIFDTGNYILPYSYWFLNKSFSTTDSLSSLPIVTPHKYLNLESLTISFIDIYNYMESKEPIDTAYTKSATSELKQQIKDAHLAPSIENTLLVASEGAADLKAVIQIKQQLALWKPISKLSTTAQVAALLLESLKTGAQTPNIGTDYPPLNNLAGVLAYSFNDFYSQSTEKADQISQNQRFVEWLHETEDKSQDDDETRLVRNLKQVLIAVNSYFIDIGLFSDGPDSNDQATLTSQGSQFMGEAMDYVNRYCQQNNIAIDGDKMLSIPNELKYMLGVINDYLMGDQGQTITPDAQRCLPLLAVKTIFDQELTKATQTSVNSNQNGETFAEQSNRSFGVQFSKLFILFDRIFTSAVTNKEANQDRPISQSFINLLDKFKKIDQQIS